MSRNVRYLHNHSQLEQKLGFPKNKVIVDKRYAVTFPDHEPFVYEDVEYIKVNTLDFVAKKGTFKALLK